MTFNFKFTSTGFDCVESSNDKDRLYIIDGITYHVRGIIKAEHTYKKFMGISYNHIYDNRISLLLYKNGEMVSIYTDTRREFQNKRVRLCIGDGFMIGNMFYTWDDYISSIIRKNKEEWKKFYI